MHVASRGVPIKELATTADRLIFVLVTAAGTSTLLLAGDPIDINLLILTSMLCLFDPRSVHPAEPNEFVKLFKSNDNKVCVYLF